MRRKAFHRVRGPRTTAPRAARELRLPRFIGLPDGVDASAVLGGLRIVIVACGAIGRAFAVALARLQPAEMRLIDQGHYKRESLNTQAISPTDIGKPKASSTGRLVKSIHPDIEVLVYDGPVADLPDDAFLGCDLVFLSSDNIPGEIEVSRRCALLGVPLLQGAVYGDALFGSLRFILNRGDGPCLVCHYGAEEWSAAHGSVRWSCDGALRGDQSPLVTTAPTMSVAGLSSLVANLALLLVIRRVLGLGEPLEDSQVDFCAYTNELVTSPLHRNPDCPADHLPCEQRTLPRPLGDFTPRELAKTAGFPERVSEGPLSFRVGRLSFATDASCGCAEPRPLNRFIAPGPSKRRCETCGERFRVPPPPGPLIPSVAVQALRAVLDRPLRDLGAHSARFAVLRDNQRAVFLTRNGSQDTRRETP